ncbi:hypothetical protein [Acetobacterium sp.]|uniref:hypothetical protein n=1 Tax=Acetobacterium sp. TaxID=1872094 RepID=UPI002F40CC4E
MKKLMIGEIMELTEDVAVETFLLGHEKTFKKGTKVTVNSNDCIIYPDGGMQKIGFEHELKGYDNRAIAERIFKWLNSRLEIGEWLEEFDVPKEEVIDVIEESLDDVLF